MFRYDGKSLENVTEEKGLGNPEFLQGKFNDKPGSLARVWTLNEDNEGNLLIGTIDAGLWKYDGKKLTNYTTKDGLSGNAIWVIYKDHQGQLFCAVNGEAIYRIEGTTFERVRF